MIGAESSGEALEKLCVAGYRAKEERFQDELDRNHFPGTS